MQITLSLCVFLKTIIDAIKWQSTNLSWIWFKISKQHILATKPWEFLRNTSTSISVTLAGQLRDEPQQSTFQDMICGFFVTSQLFFSSTDLEGLSKLECLALGRQKLAAGLGL